MPHTSCARRWRRCAATRSCSGSDPPQDPVALTRAMARIEAEAARMGTLVENLLVLARLDELPEVPTGAGRPQRAVRPRRRRRAGRGPRPPDHGDRRRPRSAATADPDAMRQVLANLTRNALIHTPEGTPIEIGLRCTDRPGGDRGPRPRPGPARGRRRARVRPLLARPTAAARRGRGGAGLGLAIVREIVEAHHGTVTAANHPEGGAVFTVTLPGAFSADSQPIPGVGLRLGLAY